EEAGYKEPTSIQAQAIPEILQGKDLLATSQTGTGKTGSFSIPILQNIYTKKPHHTPSVIKALILTPTRELASQVEESVKTYAKYLPIKTAVIFGGVGIHGQIATLRRGVDLLVATPGRLLDLIGQKAINLSHIEILVLDEADRMLDMGFINDIRKILAILPKKRQNLLFSATFSPTIRQLASSLLHSPKVIEATPQNSTAEGVSQVIHPVDTKRKQKLLSHLISSEKWQQVLVFTRTKHGANRLASALEAEGISAAAIHGNKSQGARVKALSDFKQNAVRVLVATDIAARGIDIDQLPYVVNFDLPHVPEDYVHRIGRTARAGHTGKAISLVSIDEEQLLNAIERLLKRKLPKILIPSYEPDPSIKAEPLLQKDRRKPFIRRK
ncbi:MAG: DEAD/DEAH box helicase, partial [Verrucomicrobia bacterium]|nr:DEAD/DEAH box helicase [Verrucomicrobiota bacterium]